MRSSNLRPEPNLSTWSDGDANSRISDQLPAQAESRIARCGRTYMRRSDRSHQLALVLSHERALPRRQGSTTIQVLNDFEALALSLPLSIQQSFTKLAARPPKSTRLRWCWVRARGLASRDWSGRDALDRRARRRRAYVARRSR